MINPALIFKKQSVSSGGIQIGLAEVLAVFHIFNGFEQALPVGLRPEKIFRFIRFRDDQVDRFSVEKILNGADQRVVQFGGFKMVNRLHNGGTVRKEAEFDKERILAADTKK